MSNLPHPLGDTNYGELFYPGTPSVTVADLDGPAGSRAVEFGEDGTSLAVNRGLYALAKNDEHIQARMEQFFARPNLLTFTPAGGSGGGYTFSVNVWCGDSAYLPESQSVRNGLISVLDERYNDLTDPVSGDMIVVKEILNAPAGASQVGSGFSTNPYIAFRRMNPITGALGADYTIPDGTDVWLAFGQKAQLDELVGGSSGSLQDAWFRGFTRSVGEIHAGSFLHDGSRKATGSFDMDGQSILNIDALQSVDTQPVVVRATGIGGHVDLFADDLIQFRDQYLSSYIPLNDGDTGMYGNHSSLMTSLNSQVKTGEILTGNRALNRTGSFTATPTPGLDYPDLDLMVGGEVIKVPAGNINLAAHGTGDVHVLYNPVVDAVQALSTFPPFPENFPPGGILLWTGNWGGASWSGEVDLRWPSQRSATHESWYVGDGLGGDFTDLSLLEEVLGGRRFGNLGGSFHKNHEIVIVGLATISEQFNLPANWVLRGVGNPSSVAGSPGITTTTTFPSSDYMIYCGQDCTVRDLRLVWYSSSAHQDSGLAGIRASGSGSKTLIENVEFANGAYSFRNCILGGAAYIRRCNMASASYQGYAVSCNGGDHVTDCELGPFSGGGGVGCAYLDNGNNIIERCTANTNGGPGTHIFLVRDHGNIIRDCYMDFNALGSKPFAQIEEGAGSIIELTLENNHIVDGYQFVSSAINNAGKVFLVKAEGNTLLNFTDSNFALLNTITANESSVIIRGNFIGGTLAGSAVAADSCGKVIFSDNSVVDCSSKGVEIAGSSSIIKGNFIDVAGVGFSTDYAHNLSVSNNVFDTPLQSVSVENSGYSGEMPFAISGNRFLDMGAGYAAVEVRGFSGASITGNVFGTTLARAGGGILCVPQVGRPSDNHTITGNVFREMNGDSGMAQDAIIDIEESVGDVPEGCVISNNTFETCGRPTNSTRYSQCIYARANGTTINGNSIRNLRGPSNASAKMYGIKSWGNGNSVVGNSISTDLTDSGVCYGIIVGISMDIGMHTCVGNNIHFTGSGATSTTGSIWGISAAIPDGIVNSNFIDDFNITSASNQYGIVNYNNGCIVNGNCSLRHDITSLTNGGVVLGNVVQNGGSVNPGTNATSGNVP